MYRLALFVLVCLAAFAQAPKDAPPAKNPPAEVDQALRNRVNEFFTLMKNQEYRKGEAYVAEDTKDYYYVGDKMQVHSFQLTGITYSDDFTHATAMTQVAEPISVPGFPTAEVVVQIPTHWKIEEGKWCVYEDMAKIHGAAGLRTQVATGMEQGKAAAAATAPAPAATPAYVPPPLKDLPKDPAFVLGKVTVDKPQVTIAPGGTEVVHILNGARGGFQFRPGVPPPGIEATFDQPGIGVGEKATLTLKAGKDARSGSYSFLLFPTQELLTISINVK